jgi:hypothetical protein
MKFLLIETIIYIMMKNISMLFELIMPGISRICCHLFTDTKIFSKQGVNAAMNFELFFVRNDDIFRK